MEFPSGRWYNHTIRKKDQWVQDNSVNWTQYRIILEKNNTLKHAGVNEYGDHGRIVRRFFKHPDCVNAYQNYFCWINFPRW
jgi:hypothetical protein